MTGSWSDVDGIERATGRGTSEGSGRGLGVNDEKWGPVRPPLTRVRPSFTVQTTPPRPARTLTCSIMWFYVLMRYQLPVGSSLFMPTLTLKSVLRGRKKLKFTLILVRLTV